MRKKLLEFFITCLILTGLLKGLKYLALSTGYFDKTQNVTLYVSLQTFVFIFCILGVTYKRLWQAKNLKRPVSFSLFIVAISALFFFLYNLVSVHRNLLAYYRYVNSSNFISWGSNIYKYDSLSGYALKSNLNSFLFYTEKGKVAVYTDSNGFRISGFPENNSGTLTGVDYLFLGCSFTFGSACSAENSFPYLISKQNEKKYINAGVGGYGLAQMVLLAKELIPKFRPKYVIVQRSPWLVERSLQKFAPSRGGYLIPTPYFSESNDTINIEPPLFAVDMKTLNPYDDYKNYKQRFFRYYFEKGLPFFLNQQLKLIYGDAKLFFRIKKTQSPSSEKSERLAYNLIAQIAKMNKAKIVLLNIHNGPFLFKNDIIMKTSEYTVANADSLLLNRLENNFEKNYYKKYAHWAVINNDSILIDLHPNEKAHKIIADAILSALNK